MTSEANSSNPEQTLEQLLGRRRDLERGLVELLSAKQEEVDSTWDSVRDLYASLGIYEGAQDRELVLFDKEEWVSKESQFREQLEAVSESIHELNDEIRSLTRATNLFAKLVLQTVVIPGQATSEGQLIEAVALPWFDIIDAIGRDPALAYQIPPRKWEEIIAAAYRRAGFEEVTLTPRSGDFGRDVVAVKRALGTVRVIDQVKAYGPNHLVKADDIRALLGVLQADHASKGFLTTTSDFAPRLRDDILLQPFIPSQLELINGRELIARLSELARRS